VNATTEETRSAATSSYTGTNIDITGTATLPYGRPSEYLHTTLQLRAGVSDETVKTLCRRACEEAARLWGFRNLRARRWHHEGHSDDTTIYVHDR
jgi:hypothetical protein